MEDIEGKEDGKESVKGKEDGKGKEGEDDISGPDKYERQMETLDKLAPIVYELYRLTSAFLQAMRCTSCTYFSLDLEAKHTKEELTRYAVAQFPLDVAKVVGVWEENYPAHYVPKDRESLAAFVAAADVLKDRGLSLMDAGKFDLIKLLKTC